MSDTLSRVSTAGIAIYEDDRLFHIRFLDGNRSRARRFGQLQQEALSIEYGSDLGTAVHLLCFELVPLQYIQQALSGIRSDLHFTEWTDEDDKLHRRLLSTFTLTRLRSRSCQGVWQISGVVDAWLQKTEAYQDIKINSLKAELDLDCIAWGARNIAMPLWTHIAGIQPLASLNKASFERYLGHHNFDGYLEQANESVEVRSVMADILDELDVTNPKTDSAIDFSEAFGLINQVIAIFRAREKSRSFKDSDTFLKDLLKIKAIASGKHYWLGIVICWMLDLFESGTPQKVDAAFSTRTRYCRVAAEPLLRGLIALDMLPEELGADQIETLCISIISDPSISDKQGVGAALSSFMLFLGEEFDTPVTKPQLHKFIPEVVPRAQFVSFPEVQMARTWIQDQEGADTRLKKMSRLILALLYVAPFRRDELLRIRIANVQHLGETGFFEVEIVSSQRFGKLKTKSSTRRMLIGEYWAAKELREWIGLRTNEGASSKDLLFGDIDHGDKVYRKSACIRLLLNVLKLCTCDSEMTLHALRHSWASREVEGVLRSSSIANFDRLAHVAYAMGHASTQMTLRFYSHHYEAALKQTIDLFQMACALSAHQGHCLTGIKSNTLTQRSIRLGSSISDVVHKHIQTQGLAEQVPQASGPENQSVPVLMRTFAQHLTPHQVIKVLQLIQSGKYSDELIAARTSTAESTVTRIRSIAVASALEHSTKGRRLSELVRRSMSTSDALQLAGIRFDAAENLKYSKLVDFMRLPVDIGIASSASNAWCALSKNGHIDATDELQLTRLLALMKAAEVSPNDLLLRVEVAGLTQERIALLLGPGFRSFSSVFGVQPQWQSLDFSHSARPSVSLLWTSIVDGIALTGPAAVGITGLHALLFGLTIYSNLMKE
jgi:integrase